MKKLFNIGSSIIIDDFSSLQINGPYALLNLGPDFATIKCDDTRLRQIGEDLIVDKLSGGNSVIYFYINYKN